MKKCIVKYQRDTSCYNMIKFNFIIIESFFGILCTNFSDFFELTVIVNVKMFGFKNLPIEILILDFISAEGKKL